MTLPMPGPPTHDRYARPHRQFADERCSTCYAPGWTLPKWLTDVECAAETWKAHCKLMIAEHAPFDMRMGLTPALPSVRYVYEADVWHRFATRPHALEES